MDFEKVGVGIPQLLLPNVNVNMKKWSVIACDQHTSQPEYWGQVERLVGNAPSALHIILPEVYLEQEGLADNIGRIKSGMQEYIEKGVLEQLPPGVMLVERTMGGSVRKGLVMLVDLEKYEYQADKKPLVRATEKTLLERIPPRITIRQGAMLETSHVMILMDDETDSVIGPLYRLKESFEKMYDFDLMMDGGKIKGYFIQNEELLLNMLSAMEQLPVRDGMRFCVGDGNHSLATAKTVWELQKEQLPEEERAGHPLRYALCEFVNLQDPGISFMPIHRVLFNVNPTQCLSEIVERLNKKGLQAKIIFGRWRGGAEAAASNELPFLYRDGAGRIVLEKRSHALMVGEFQDVLDEYMLENPSAAIDYIHGQEEFEAFARDYDNLGLYFPSVSKDQFFDTVVSCGVLPKKSFSMGEAEEKRYYTECRLLVPRQAESDEEQAEDCAEQAEE